MADPTSLAQALSFSPQGGKDKLVKGYARQQQPTLDVPVQAFGIWDSVQLVQQALTDLENGTFLQASLLCDSTGRDDRISGALSARINGVLSLPLEFEPGIEDSEKAAQVAEECEANWTSMFPESELSKLLKWGRLVGIAPGELVWNVTDTSAGKRWMPVVNVWHPQFLNWNWTWRDYQILTMTDGIQKLGGTPGRWFAYTPNGRYLAWQTGLIRALAIPFLIRWWAYRDWARYSEKHGMPIFKAMVPKKADEPTKNAYFQSLAALGPENTIRCEVGTEQEGKFDAELLEPQANTWGGFQALIEKCDSSIAILLLGQNLTTEVKGGSYAAATVHERVRADFLRADAATLSTFLREEVLKPWAVFNFGNAELAPWPVWHSEPPEDRKSKADAHLTASQALNQLHTANAPVDDRKFLEGFDIPLLTPEEAAARAAEEKKNPPPAPPKAPNPPIPSPGDKEAAPKAFFDALVGLDITGLTAEETAHRANLLGKLGLRLSAAKKKEDALPPSYVAAQIFADELSDSAIEEGKKAIESDLAGVLEDVRSAEGYDDLRVRIKSRLAGKMDRKKIASIVEKATLLAHSAGRKAVSDATK